jgi:signal transduction histidine kinase
VLSENKVKKILKSITRYVIFFLLIAFVVTCCMLLFISVMIKSMDIELSNSDISMAALLTMGNVVILSVFFTAFDTVRRRLTVDRQVKQISMATEQICKGNFDVSISSGIKLMQDDNFSVIIEDISRMAEELSGVETLRTDFIANVSHELKTPLAVIQNYAAMLIVPDLPEEERIKYAKSIIQSSKSLAGLITNILKLNKLENQNIFPESKKYDLGEQLCECFLQYEDIWEQKEIEIDTDIEDGIFIKSDPELFSIVWSNLFSNAFKFTEKGGRVRLSLHSLNGYAAVSITDTGCGMDSITGAHIFDKFYQGDTSHAGQGNGLGLALVKRIIDITQSDISVNSELGKGTAFVVKIKREK